MDEDKPPSQSAMDNITASIPPDDTQSRQRMGIWAKLAQSFFCPPGSSVCSRCFTVLGNIQKE